MKEIFVRIVLCDPVTDEEFEVFEDIGVEVAELLSYNPSVGINTLQLIPDKANKIFSIKSSRYKTTKSHYFRIGFRKTNFSKSLRKLLSLDEVDANALPVYCPARIPYWDSGWDDNYETNEYFDSNDAKFNSSKSEPLKIKIPIRLVYNIGHRGAPHFFPENTIASFKQALDVGANGIEFDLCFTKDEKIAIFHDAKPVKYPSNIDRTMFESLPYELVSPEFSNDKRTAFIKKLVGTNYVTNKEIQVKTGKEFDIINLTLNEVRQYYKYMHVKGVEHNIPDINELLSFASSESSRLNVMFFDVKNPEWDENRDKNKFIQYGELIGMNLKKYPVLPAKLVIANVSEKVLSYLKKGIANSGETRCEFALDVEGGLGAVIGAKNNPLSMARILDNTVVSIGSLLRPGNLNEISEAARDRDYNNKSKLTIVIHWTLNEPSQMYLSFSAGVNGIVTDKPDELKKTLAKLKVRIS